MIYPVATLIPAPGRTLLAQAAATHSVVRINAAIRTVKATYPHLFKKEK